MMDQLKRRSAFAKPDDKFISPHGFRKQPTLPILHASVHQIFDLDFALDAFGHDFNPQFVCHLDDMRRNDARCRVLCNGVDK